MWQFAESIRGMRDACEGLGTPVTGGNVSFYNESGDSAIDPTPVIGMLGLLRRLPVAGAERVPRARASPSISSARRPPSWAAPSSPRRCSVSVDRHAAGARSGPGAGAPRSAGGRGRPTLLASAHDCGDGGLAVALAECAIGAGHGFAVSIPTDLPAHVALFSESASRAVVSVAPLDEEAVPCARRGARRPGRADRRDRRAARRDRRVDRHPGRGARPRSGLRRSRGCSARPCDAPARRHVRLLADARVGAARRDARDADRSLARDAGGGRPAADRGRSQRGVRRQLGGVRGAVADERRPLGRGRQRRVRGRRTSASR